MNEPRVFYTTGELAKLCSVTRRTVYNWSREGLIPSFKCGKDFIFEKSVLDKLIPEWQKPKTNPRKN